ncbi:MAG: hypothetical protein Q7R84_01245 [bacterium]|nr:hypothetical protein [bacterium]
MTEEYLTEQNIQQSGPSSNGHSKRTVGGWLIWLTLFLIYPLGLILLWRFSGWSTKRKLILAFIAPVIIAIISLLFYFTLIHTTSTSWEKNYQKKVQETKDTLSDGEQTTTSNADAETLTNSQYNYSFSYPKEIYILPGNDPQMMQFSIRNGSYDIDVQSYEITSGTKVEVEDIVSHPEDDLRENYHKISQEEISVGGVKALRIAWINVMGNKAIWRVSTYFINNTIGYYLNYYERPYLQKPTTLEEKVGNPPNLSSYNMVLSSFMFLK